MAEDTENLHGDIFPCYGNVERGAIVPSINSTPNWNSDDAHVQQTFDASSGFGGEAGIPGDRVMSKDAFVLPGYIIPLDKLSGGVFIAGYNSTPNLKANGPDLTLAKLQQAMDSLPNLPKLPPYYRAHPITISNLMAATSQADGKIPLLSGVEVREDTSVPLGEFLPPEGWTDGN